MSAKWDRWADRFAAHYDVERAQLDRLLDGAGDGFRANLDSLPTGFDFDEAVKSAGIAKNAIKYDAGGKKLVVDGKLHLLPTEQARLLDVVKEAQKASSDKSTFEPLLKAIREVALRASRLSFRERLAATLKGDPDRVGIPLKGSKDDEKVQYVVVGQADYYKSMVKRYEDKYAEAKTKYQWDHLERQWSDLQKIRRDLVGPVQALEKDLVDAANKLLSEQQIRRGPLPDEMTPMRRSDLQTIWGLVILGFLLIAGLFSRLASLGGAVLLMLFYMAMPPWPGYPEIPGIEHNIIINKVSVEATALLALATMPSGKWFGLDALIAAIFARRGKA